MTRLPGTNAGLAGALLGLAAALLTAPGPAVAQSLLSAGGLGIPSEPLDARSRALGSAGAGIAGWGLLPTDPGSAAGIFLPTIALSMQPLAVSVDGGEDGGRTRFPQLAASYPYRNVIVSLQFGSFLEQEWEARSERTVMLAEEEVRALDVFQSLGGVGVVRLGAAYRLSETLSVGGNVGTYIGAIERRFSRTLDPTQASPEVESYRARGRWRASGNTVTLGAAWDPSPLFRVAASASHSGKLELSPVGFTSGSAKSYPMPLEVRAGGTFVLSDGVALALGLGYADWSATSGALDEGESRGGTWTFGGGIELAGSTLLGRPMPLRLGVREQQLPFHFQGTESSERSYSAGFGLNLVESQQLPIARFDFSVERGSRSAGPTSEDFWRSTISIRLAGG